jgi:hypothetical protein
MIVTVRSTHDRLPHASAWCRNSGPHDLGDQSGRPFDIGAASNRGGGPRRLGEILPDVLARYAQAPAAVPLPVSQAVSATDAAEV